MADSQGRTFALAPGQAHEASIAPALLDGLPDAPGWVVGDRGLSSTRLREQAWTMGEAGQGSAGVASGTQQRATSGHPGQEKRGARALPRLHLDPPQPDRAPVGPAQGMVSRGDPL